MPVRSVREVVHATVDGDHGAGDVACRRRGEEGDEARHVFRLPEITDRNVALDEAATRFLGRMELCRICSELIRPGWIVFTVTPSAATSHDRPLAQR